MHSTLLTPPMVPQHSVNVLGVDVHPLTVEQLHAWIALYAASRAHAMILHVNIHGLNLAWDRPWLRKLLNRAEIVFCDGAGVKLGAKILGHYIPQRITYADWMWQLGAFAERQGLSFYLLGGSPGVAEKAAEKLQARFPKLQIVGTHHGYFDKSPGSAESFAVIRKINAAQPNILLTSLSMPVQEEWLMHYWDDIRANVALTGGAALDYVSGTVQRGPRILTDHSMEWLARMLIEPKRLWKRYIIGNPVFMMRIMQQRLGMKVGSK